MKTVKKILLYVLGWIFVIVVWAIMLPSLIDIFKSSVNFIFSMGTQGWITVCVIAFIIIGFFSKFDNHNNPNKRWVRRFTG